MHVQILHCFLTTIPVSIPFGQTIKMQNLKYLKLKLYFELEIHVCTVKLNMYCDNVALFINMDDCKVLHTTLNKYNGEKLTIYFPVTDQWPVTSVFVLMLCQLARTTEPSCSQP